jgi:hypothetical protein
MAYSVVLLNNVTNLPGQVNDYIDYYEAKTMPLLDERWSTLIPTKGGCKTTENSSQYPTALFLGPNP